MKFYKLPDGDATGIDAGDPVPACAVEITPEEFAQISVQLSPQSLAAIQNVKGFIADVKTGVGGILGANALMSSYPAFFPAIEESAWNDVQTLTLDAQAKNVLTTDQYNAIKSAAAANNIPITLP